MRERDNWQLRPAITAALGLAAAVTIQQLVDDIDASGVWFQPEHWRVALATAIGIAAVLAIFTVERIRTAWSVVFSLGAGIVAGAIYWWNGPVGGGEYWDWRTACLFLAIAVAAPLFQTARDAGGRRFDYVEVHGNVWTNIVLFGAAGAFTGIAFALTYLLSELFSLIGIHVLRDLLKHGSANAALFGAAFGGAAGLFRERDAVVRTLQRVATAVLAVLAPVLGVGLLLFLIALPFTGLSALWEATKATTPILLACVIGGLVLINAVLGDGEEEERGRVLHWGAMALGLAVLPLATIAAIATGLRIDQYGFTPDRLWALTFVIVACAYGVAYLVTLVRWRQGWAARLRPANLTLAFGLCGLALLLATPIVSFNAISTRDQVARLESGRIAPEKFDWAALGFDFGEPGKAALKRLTRSANPIVARLASAASSKPNRYEVADTAASAERRDALLRIVRVLPAPVTLPDGVVQLLSEWEVCGGATDSGCIVLYTPGADQAVAVSGGCVAPVRSDRRETRCSIGRMARVGGTWRADPRVKPQPDEATTAIMRADAARNAIEVRPVARRQVFIGGRPVGDPFE